MHFLSCFRKNHSLRNKNCFSVHLRDRLQSDIYFNQNCNIFTSNLLTCVGFYFYNKFVIKRIFTRKEITDL